ncbi:hypothetical protein PO909_016576 [Leuciscus waleckii]
MLPYRLVFFLGFFWSWIPDVLSIEAGFFSVHPGAWFLGPLPQLTALQRSHWVVDMDAKH